MIRIANFSTAQTGTQGLNASCCPLHTPIMIKGNDDLWDDDACTKRERHSHSATHKRE